MFEEKVEFEFESFNREMSNYQVFVIKLISQQFDGVVYICIGKKVMFSSCKYIKLCDQNLNKSQLFVNQKKMFVIS